MRTQRTELLLLGAIGIFLVLASLLSARDQQDDSTELLSGSSYSSGASGGRALYLWLDTLGYNVQRLEPSPFVVRPARGVLWILAPSEFIGESEAERIAAWVRAGGTLVWADSQPSRVLLDEFGLEVTSSFSLAPLRPVTPWLQHPAATYRGGARFSLPPDAVPLLADSAGASGALRLPVESGELWLFGTEEPFTNRALHEEQNSALVEGLLHQLPRSTPHLFDEFHHGFGESARADWSLFREMRRTPWGWGIFYGAGTIALWLLLRGRAFGRPLPLPGEHLRREAGEYVRSMAWLYRRAQLHAPILHHHHGRLKRRLTQRYRLPQTADDAAFVQALARHQPDLDKEALVRHLHALHLKNPTDAQLQALARANDEWLARLL